MQIPGYQIIRKINSGGMASVYLAEKNDTNATNTQAEACKQKIIRGGSFRNKVTAISSQAITHLAADTHNDSTGFRVVKELDEEKKIERESNKEDNRNIFQRLINKLRQ